ncbi:dephospho-CoA kinase [Hasllibacter halocynthiae]|uniref:Dephospho-CoA kinase n=1 Tax=Hasllibacter halocynthiae TaxID=595589 RepID=A0A2T0X2G7_9RHOB|nr:dephospho-CoA kinase [Hasllibacter halocynthiae]PRY93131.1 dephospho-CoA kinase [Hasllibacter halocynthiae]
MTRAGRIVGLTGSVGMGKTTTAEMFAAAGLPVWDADAEVGRLYAPGGAGVPVVEARFPQAVRDGAVDRAALRAALLSDAGALAAFEGEIHAHVAKARREWIDARAGDVILDVPLLFEAGIDAGCDLVVVCSAPEALQRERVLAREGMTEDRLAVILSRQMPDAEKRARADFVIDTSTMERAREGVRRVLEALR